MQLFSSASWRQVHTDLRSLPSQGCCPIGNRQLVRPSATSFGWSASINDASRLTGQRKGPCLTSSSHRALVAAAASKREGQPRERLGLPQPETEEEARQRIERSLLPLKDVLKIVNGGSSAIKQYAEDTGSTRASVAALLLYSLGKHAQRGMPAEHRDDISAAVITLADELTAMQRRSPPGTVAGRPVRPQPLLAELDPRPLALCAWAACKLQQPRAHILELCTAILEHAVHSSILDRFEFANWALLAYGLSGLGFKCDQSNDLRQFFRRAAAFTVRALSDSSHQPAGQDLRDIIYAGAKAGATDVDWHQYITAVAAAHAAGTAMADATPQSWSNMLWACKELDVYEETFLIAAAQTSVQQAEGANPQQLSNTLHALADIGWYDPAMYDTLIMALVEKASDANTQDLSNALYACYTAQHVTAQVQALASAAMDYSDLRRWEPQALCNTLLACAYFQAHATAKAWGDTAPVASLSQALFRSASQSDLTAFDTLDLSQLQRAHLLATQLGTPGLPADNAVLEVVNKGRQKHLKGLVHGVVPPLQRDINGAAAATGRYRSVAPYIRDSSVLVQGAVKHLQLGYTLVLYAIEAGKYLRDPLGRLSGPTQLLVDELAAGFTAVVVVYEHEWAALGRDPRARRGYMDRLLQQAEAAIAAAGTPTDKHQQQQQQQQGQEQGWQQQGQGHIADISPPPRPIIIGLLPQDAPASQAAAPAPASSATAATSSPTIGPLLTSSQADVPDTAQAESADSTAAATPEPPAPKLTPSQVQARLKELDQKQQTFFQGLPPVATPSLNGGKSPAQQQQQQQQQQPLKPPQAPALRPPRRPGA